MSVLRGRNMRLLSLLAILPIALACYYEQVGMENPLPYCMRACQLEVNDARQHTLTGQADKRSAAQGTRATQSTHNAAR